MLRFNCAILGGRGTGKTSFINRHLSGEFSDGGAAAEIESHELVFHTNRGPMCFVVWETHGEASAPIELKVEPECAIVLFDVTSESSYKNVVKWKTAFAKASRFQRAVITCGNMVDLQFRYGQGPEFRNGRYDISVKKDFNLGKPFLWLARRLVGDLQLRFVPQLAPPPPQQPLDDAAKREMDVNLILTKKIPLPGRV
ncbi:GTP-binding nuclear protein Ran-like [Drosophila miranda]|uniref:GTP-binding nuclear protein Ran-like n=1 Tax=Drosophila miranda TaxID=7229 RepID=UPI0007E74C64|nr:GTP-binding nuclear protein Ran-like [Drosophila miranda]